MKNALLLTFLLIGAFSFAQTTDIPDANFEQALIDLGHDTGFVDGTVPTANISGITSLDVNSKSISSLTGIEDFTALEVLKCQINNLSSLDLSNNTALRILQCQTNSLTSLNIANGNNSNITTFKAYANNLTCITTNEAYFMETNFPVFGVSFYCTGYTAIPDPNFEQALIDLGHDDALDGYVLTSTIAAITYLYVNSKSISDLTGIEDFSALTHLSCDNNDLTSLDVSTNTALETLSCYDNSLGSLDVSANSVLTKLYCYSNSLTSLDMSNIIYSSLTEFNTKINPNLTCINVDDVTYMDTNFGSTVFKDATASYGAHCYETYVPDDNFEQALIDLGHDDVLDDYVLSSTIASITSLDVNSKSISDLTGIEDFTALTDLNCRSNSLITLDISNNTALTVLYCNNNSLTALDVTNNVLLTELRFNNNSLSSNVDLSKNIFLEFLYCNNSGLTALDLSKNVVLETVRSNNNPLLATLNIANGNNYNLTEYNFTDTNLSCITTDEAYFMATNYATVSTHIDRGVSYYCTGYTTIPDTNFEQALIDLGHDVDLDGYVLTSTIAAITSLDINSESIGSLVGIEDFTALTVLYCNNNSLTALDVTNNMLLTELRFNNNNLSSNVDLSKNVVLEFLYCNNSGLTALDLSKNVVLETVRSNNNPLLATLNIANGNNYNLTEFNFTDTNLSCITTDEAYFMATNYATVSTHIDSGVSYYCTDTYTTIPDANFEQALIDLGHDDGLDGYVLTSTIAALTSLDVSSKNISDLTGIEDFTSLSILYCYTNNFSSLDLSSNIALTQLRCGNNSSLTSLDIRNNNNSNFTEFTATAASNLTCIRTLEDTFMNTYFSSTSSIDVTARYCNYTEISDANFEQALIDLGHDTGVVDGKIPTANILGITSLDVNSKSISSLTGIENFTALTTLNCYTNSLTSLDLSNNNHLTSLDCNDNSLTSLDVSANTALEDLYCHNNNLSGLDLSNNNHLTRLYCNDNSLTSLDISNIHNYFDLILNFNSANNPNLTCINVDDSSYIFDLDVTYGVIGSKDFTASYGEHCYETYVPANNFEQALIDLGYDDVLDDYVLTSTIAAITSLDISSKNISDLTGIEDFTALTTLYCDTNNFSSLDLSNNINLTTLYCYTNNFSSLDLSNNINLTALRCGNNSSLSTLDIRNNNNSNFTEFKAASSPNLTCILTLEDTFMNANFSSTNSIDATASYCNYTEIPDANFEQALIDLGHDDAMDGYVLTSTIETVASLQVDNKSINSLTGIENFTALKTLKCFANTISTLDLTSNTALITLGCQGNNLTELDLSKNTALKSLNCSYNSSLATLNIKNGNNSNLTSLNTKSTNLTCIETNEAYFMATNYATVSTHIDSGVSYYCTDTYTTIPDANFEQALIDLGHDDGLDGYVLTSAIEDLTSLDVNSKSISSLTGIEDFTALTNLNCRSNNLITLDVSNNIALTVLYCNNNSLTALNVTNNVLLTELRFNNNSLSSNVDLTKNVVLDFLYCNNSGLTALDLSNNVLLETVRSNNNPLLATLNIANGNNYNLTYFDFRDTNLTCINVDDGADTFMTANFGTVGTHIDSGVIYSTDCNEYLNTPSIKINSSVISVENSKLVTNIKGISFVVYTLTGLQIANANLPTGIYIVKAIDIVTGNTNTFKVIVK